MVATACARLRVDVLRPRGLEPRVAGPGRDREAQAFVAGVAEYDAAALAGSMRHRGDAGLGGELVLRLETLGVLTELSNDLCSVHLAGAREGHHDLTCGGLCDVMLDAAGEDGNALDQCAEHSDERLDELALGFLLELAGEASGGCAQALEENGRGTTSAVAMSCQKRRKTLLAEPSRAARGWVALEEGERDRRVDVSEDGASAGPEAVEQRPELVRDRHPLGHQVVAGADDSTQSPDLVGRRPQPSETVSIGAQHVGEDVGIARVALAASGPVARSARLQRVRVDRHDGVSGIDERIHHEATGTLDGDGELSGRRNPGEPAKEPTQPLCSVLHIELRDDGALLVDDAGGMLSTTPVESSEILHGQPPASRGITFDRAGRSCRSLTERRSGGCVSNAFGPVALHPVAGSGLPVSARGRVSCGLSSSKRFWPSSQRHGRSDAPSRTSRAGTPTNREVHQ